MNGRASITDTLLSVLHDATRPADDDLSTLHARLTDALRITVRQGVLQPGSLIPGERDLAGSLGLSRVTVRRAIKTLVGERLLVQRPGARTSVAQRVEKPVAVFAGFSDDMLSRGMRPGTTWISRSVAAASPDEALALSLSPGAPVCRLARLRTADDRGMALEWSVVPTTVLPDPQLVGNSLYQALRQRGIVPVRALQRMRATVASPEEAARLGVVAGAPLLDMERRCFDESGRAVEFCRSLYRGDRYDLLVELGDRLHTG